MEIDFVPDFIENGLYFLPAFVGYSGAVVKHPVDSAYGHSGPSCYFGYGRLFCHSLTCNYTQNYPKLWTFTK